MVKGMEKKVTYLSRLVVAKSLTEPAEPLSLPGLPPEGDEGSRSFSPDFPDGMAVSAWRLRHFPEKPSVSDHSLPKRQRNPMGDSQKDALRVDFDHHIKYLTFQLAEVAVPRELFAQILERIARLCPACASG